MEWDFDRQREAREDDHLEEVEQEAPRVAPGRRSRAIEPTATRRLARGTIPPGKVTRSDPRIAERLRALAAPGKRPPSVSLDMSLASPPAARVHELPDAPAVDPAERAEARRAPAKRAKEPPAPHVEPATEKDGETRHARATAPVEPIAAPASRQTQKKPQATRKAVRSSQGSRPEPASAKSWVPTSAPASRSVDREHRRAGRIDQVGVAIEPRQEPAAAVIERAQVARAPRVESTAGPVRTRGEPPPPATLATRSAERRRAAQLQAVPVQPSPQPRPGERIVQPSFELRHQKQTPSTPDGAHRPPAELEARERRARELEPRDQERDPGIEAASSQQEHAAKLEAPAPAPERTRRRERRSARPAVQALRAVEAGTAERDARMRAAVTAAGQALALARARTVVLRRPDIAVDRTARIDRPQPAATLDQVGEPARAGRVPEARPGMPPRQAERPAPPQTVSVDCPEPVVPAITVSSSTRISVDREHAAGRASLAAERATELQVGIAETAQRAELIAPLPARMQAVIDGSVAPRLATRAAGQARAAELSVGRRAAQEEIAIYGDALVAERGVQATCDLEEERSAPMVQDAGGECELDEVDARLGEGTDGEVAAVEPVSPAPAPREANGTRDARLDGDRLDALDRAPALRPLDTGGASARGELLQGEVSGRERELEGARPEVLTLEAPARPARAETREQRRGQVRDRRDAIREIEDALVEAANAQYPGQIEQASAPALREHRASIASTRAQARTDIGAAVAEGQAKQAAIAATPPPVDRAKVQADAGARYQAADAEAAAATGRTEAQVSTATAAAATQVSASGQAKQTQVAAADTTFQAGVQQGEATRAQEEATAQAGLATATAAAASTMAAEQSTAKATAASEKSAAKAQTDAKVQDAEQKGQEQQQKAQQQSQQEQRKAQQDAQQQQQQAQARADAQIAAQRAAAAARAAALEAQGRQLAAARIDAGKMAAENRLAQAQAQAAAIQAAAEAKAASLRAQAAAQRAKGGLLNKIGAAIKSAIGGLLAAAAAVLAAGRAAAMAALAAGRAAAQAIMAAARAAWAAIVQTYKALVQGVIQAVMAVVAAIIQAVAAVRAAITAALAAIVSALIAALAAMVTAIIAATRALVVAFLDGLVAIVTAIDAELGQRLEQAVQGFRTKVNAAAAVATAAIQAAAVTFQAVVQAAAAAKQQEIAAAEAAYLAAVTAIETALVAAVEVLFDTLQTTVDELITAAEQDVDAMITAAEVLLTAFVTRQQRAIVVAQVELDKAVDQVISAARKTVDAVGDAIQWVVDKVPNNVVEGFIDFWNGPWRDMVIIGVATIAAVAISVATFGTGAPVAAILLAAVIGGVMAGSAYGAGELAARHGEVELEQDRPDEIYVPNYGYLKPSDIQTDPLTGEMVLPDGMDPTMFQWAMSNFDVDPGTGEIQAKSHEALLGYVASEALEGFVSGFLSAGLAVAGGGLGAAVGGRVANFAINRAVAHGMSRAAATSVTRAVPAMVGGTVEGSVDVLSGGVTSATTSIIEALESGASIKDAMKGGLETLKYGLTDPTSIGASLLMGVTAGGQAKWIDPRFERGMESGLMRDPAVKRAATDMLIETLSEQAGSGLGLGGVELVAALGEGQSLDEAIRRAVARGSDYYSLTNIAMSVAMNVAGGMAEADTRRGVFGDISHHLPFGPSPGPDGPHHHYDGLGNRNTNTPSTTTTGPSPSTSNAGELRSTLKTLPDGSPYKTMAALPPPPEFVAYRRNEGHTSEVLARDQKTGKEFVVTRYSEDRVDSVAAARREAPRVQALEPFGGPAFLGFVEVPDKVPGYHLTGIATEKIDGVSIQDALLGNKPFPLTQAHRDSLATLIARLDAAGLTPVDLSGSNLLLTPDGRVVPVGFSLTGGAGGGGARTWLSRLDEMVDRQSAMSSLPSALGELAGDLPGDRRRDLVRLVDAEARGQVIGLGDWLTTQAAERQRGRDLDRIGSDLADLRQRLDQAPPLDLRGTGRDDAAPLAQDLPDRPPIQTDPRTAERLRQFEHIVMDAHSMRGGQGDVAAAYLTALDLMNRHQYAGTIDILVTAEGVHVLQRMTGRRDDQPLDGGDLIAHDGPGTLRVVRSDASPDSIEPADLVLRLAAGYGEVDNAFFRFRDGEIRLTDDAVLEAQTVFESSESYDRKAYSKVNGGPELAHRPPGVRPDEAGVYTDPVAYKLRHESPAGVREHLVSAIDRMPRALASEQRVLSQLVGGQALAGSERAMAYGLTHYMVDTQVESYVDGLVERARRTGKSTVVITPSAFPKKLRDRVDYYKATDAAREGALPHEATPGRVYVIETGSLPHDVFVGLMADSTVPPIVAGDGAMSAAMTLGVPFAMTKVAHNEPAVAGLRDHLASHADADQMLLIDQVFNRNDPDLRHAADLADPRYQQLFAALGAEVPSVTDRTVEVAAETRALSEHRPPDGDPIDEARSITDPDLRVERLLQRSEQGDPAAARLIAHLVASDVKGAKRMIMRDVLTPASLEHPSVTRAIEDHLKSDFKSIDDAYRHLAGVLGRAAASGNEGAARALARTLDRHPNEMTTFMVRRDLPLAVLQHADVMGAFERSMSAGSERARLAGAARGVDLLVRAQPQVPATGAALARFVRRDPDTALEIADRDSPVWSTPEVVTAIRGMLVDPASASRPSTARLASMADLSSEALAGTGDPGLDAARAFEMAAVGDPLATPRAESLLRGDADGLQRGDSRVTTTTLPDGTSVTVEAIPLAFQVDGVAASSGGTAWIIDGPSGRRVILDEGTGRAYERSPEAAAATEALAIPHRPLGPPMDRAQAEASLDLLRVGMTYHALSDLGYPSSFMGQDAPNVLWGIGRQADGQYRLVRGSETDVQFGDLEPVAQTHSVGGRLEQFQAGSAIALGQIADPDHQTPEARADLTRLLPPPATLTMLADRGSADYQVATPFTLSGTAGMTTYDLRDSPKVDLALRDVHAVGAGFELTVVARTAADPKLENQPRTLSEDTIRVEVDPDGGLRSVRRPPPFQNVVVDARNSIAGQGDAAAGYFTAIDMVKQLGDGAQVTLLADDKTLRLLTAMRDAPVTAGSTIDEGGARVRVETVDSLPPTVGVADLYLSMGRPSGARKHMNGQEPSLIDDSTVRIAQTVFGNTNDDHAERPNANMWRGDEKYEISPPGLAPHEGGIYADPLAERLGTMTGDERRRELGTAVERIPHAPTRDGLRALLEGSALDGSRLGLAYGISEPTMRPQFNRYLSGLLAEADRSGTSYAVVTPSHYREHNIPPQLRDRVRFVSLREGQSLPPSSDPGVITIVETPTLPRDVFVGLMAASEIPPIVSGDNSLSAALALGQPFVMTQIDWNTRTIESVKDRLARRADPDQRALLDAVFGDGSDAFGLPAQGDLSRALELLDPANRRLFEAVQAELPNLTRRILEVAKLARREPSFEVAMKTADAGMRTSLLVKAAGSDPDAAALVASRLLAEPERAQGMVVTGLLDGRALSVDVVRSGLADALSLSDSPWMRAFGKLLTDDPAAALAAIATERVRLLFADPWRAPSPDADPLFSGLHDGGSASPHGADGLAGIDYFARADAEDVRRFEQGTPGQPGSVRALYNPRTGELKVRKIQADGRALTWGVNERTGAINHGGTSTGLGVGGSSAAVLQKIRAEIDELGPAMGGLGFELHDRPIGYPGVAEAIARTTSTEPVAADDIRSGDVILFQDASDHMILTRATGVEELEHRPGSYLVLTSGWDAIGGNGLVIARDASSVRPATSFDNTFGEPTPAGVLHSRGEPFHRDEGPRLAWRVSDQDASVLAGYRPWVEEMTPDGWTRGEVAIHASLQGMQYTRWGIDEVDWETRGSPELREEWMARLADATPENYGRALDALIERFGEAEFARVARDLFQMHLMGLHTVVHTPWTPYKAHADMRPLGPPLTGIGAQAIGRVHPMPQDMHDSGHVVNVRPLFGDADFWAHMRDHHPDLFDGLVDWLATQPSSIEQRGTYGVPVLIDPIALVQQHFPDAFDVIHGARPDFDATGAEAVRRVDDEAPAAHDHSDQGGDSQVTADGTTEPLDVPFVPDGDTTLDTTYTTQGAADTTGGGAGGRAHAAPDHDPGDASPRPESAPPPTTVADPALVDSVDRTIDSGDPLSVELADPAAPAAIAALFAEQGVLPDELFLQADLVAGSGALTASFTAEDVARWRAAFGEQLMVAIGVTTSDAFAPYQASDISALLDAADRIGSPVALSLEAERLAAAPDDVIPRLAASGLPVALWSLDPDSPTLATMRQRLGGAVIDLFGGARMPLLDASHPIARGQRGAADAGVRPTGPMTKDITGPVGALTGLPLPADGSPRRPSLPMPPAADGTKPSTRPFVGPLFRTNDQGTPQITLLDIHQGQLGDCYYIATLNAVGKARPDVLSGMVHDNGDGTYDVTFQDDSPDGETTVTVDNRLYVEQPDRPLYAEPGRAAPPAPKRSLTDRVLGRNDLPPPAEPVMWGPIVEKAWAQVHESYGAIEGDSGTHDIINRAIFGVTASASRDVSMDAVTPEDLGAQLQHAFDDHVPVVVAAPSVKFHDADPPAERARKNELVKKLADAGVVGSHGYSLTEAANGTFTLHNPWGFKHLENVDAAFIKDHFLAAWFLPVADSMTSTTPAGLDLSRGRVTESIITGWTANQGDSGDTFMATDRSGRPFTAVSAADRPALDAFAERVRALEPYGGPVYLGEVQVRPSGRSAWTPAAATTDVDGMALSVVLQGGADLRITQDHVASLRELQKQIDVSSVELYGTRDGRVVPVATERSFRVFRPDELEAALDLQMWRQDIAELPPEQRLVQIARLLAHDAGAVDDLATIMTDDPAVVLAHLHDGDGSDLVPRILAAPLLVSTTVRLLTSGDSTRVALARHILQDGLDQGNPGALALFVEASVQEPGLVAGIAPPTPHRTAGDDPPPQRTEADRVADGIDRLSHDPTFRSKDALDQTMIDNARRAGGDDQVAAFAAAAEVVLATERVAQQAGDVIFDGTPTDADWERAARADDAHEAAMQNLRDAAAAVARLHRAQVDQDLADALAALPEPTLTAARTRDQLAAEAGITPEMARQIEGTDAFVRLRDSVDARDRARDALADAEYMARLEALRADFAGRRDPALRESDSHRRARERVEARQRIAREAETELRAAQSSVDTIVRLGVGPAAVRRGARNEWQARSADGIDYQRIAQESFVRERIYRRPTAEMRTLASQIVRVSNARQTWLASGGYHTALQANNSGIPHLDERLAFMADADDRAPAGAPRHTHLTELRDRGMGIEVEHVDSVKFPPGSTVSNAGRTTGFVVFHTDAGVVIRGGYDMRAAPPGARQMSDLLESPASREAFLATVRDALAGRGQPVDIPAMRGHDGPGETSDLGRRPELPGNERRIADLPTVDDLVRESGLTRSALVDLDAARDLPIFRSRETELDRFRGEVGELLRLRAVERQVSWDRSHELKTTGRVSAATEGKLSRAVLEVDLAEDAVSASRLELEREIPRLEARRAWWQTAHDGRLDLASTARAGVERAGTAKTPDQYAALSVTSTQAVHDLKARIGHLLAADTSASGRYSLTHAALDRGMQFDFDLATVSSGKNGYTVSVRPDGRTIVVREGRRTDGDGRFMPDLLETEGSAAAFLRTVEQALGLDEPPGSARVIGPDPRPYVPDSEPDAVDSLFGRERSTSDAGGGGDTRIAPSPLDVPFLPGLEIAPAGGDISTTSVVPAGEAPEAGAPGAVRPTLEELAEKLFFVHTTKFMPQDGAVGYRADDADFYRPTIHWSLGEGVREHGAWYRGDMALAIVAPLRAVRPQLANVFTHDSFTVGPQPLSPDTTLVAPIGADVSGLPEGVPVHLYDPDRTTLRQAIDDTIAGAGGWAIRMRAGDTRLGSPARLDGVDINNQEFFHALFAADPALSFGTHLESERGEGFRFGVVDTLLWNTASYGSDPVAAVMIRHHLAEIDRWAAGRELPARALDALAERKQHALRVADSIDREVTGEAAARAAGGSIYLAEPKLFASMDGPEIDRFFASSSPLFSQMTDGQRAAFRANWAAQRAALVGPKGIAAEQLDVELVRAFNASGVGTDIGRLLRDALDARSPLLDSALSLLRRPDVAGALAADWGVTVTAGWPRNLDDVLRAHPDTRDALADGAAADTPARQRAAETLAALGFDRPAGADGPPPTSFKDAADKARENHRDRVETRSDLDEVATRPLREIVPPDDLFPGERLRVYERIRQSGVERVFERAGLGDQLRARFDSEADFWQSRQTLADIHADLSKISGPQDRGSRSLEAEGDAVAQELRGLRNGGKGAVRISGRRLAGGLAAALLAAAAASLRTAEEELEREREREPPPPPGFSDDLAAFAGAGERSPFDPSDVSQGGLGDCYLMASIAAIAARNPELLDALIERNADGTYTVTFFGPDGEPVTVVLDGQFPLDENGDVRFAQPGDAAEIWVQLLEKAYAQYMARQDPLAASGGLDPYGGIGNGGWMEGVLEALTGRASESSWNPNIHRGGRMSFSSLYINWHNGKAITLGTLSEEESANNPLYGGDRPRLVNGHAYYVTAVDPNRRTVTIRNPWGWDTGEIVLTADEFDQSFVGEASVSAKEEE